MVRRAERFEPGDFEDAAYGEEAFGFGDYLEAWREALDCWGTKGARGTHEGLRAAPICVWLRLRVRSSSVYFQLVIRVLLDWVVM